MLRFKLLAMRQAIFAAKAATATASSKQALPESKQDCSTLPSISLKQPKLLLSIARAFLIASCSAANGPSLQAASCKQLHGEERG